MLAVVSSPSSSASAAGAGAAVSIDATVTGASFIIGASVAGGLVCDESAEIGAGADFSRSEVIGMPIDSRKRARVALASERVEEGRLLLVSMSFGSRIKSILYLKYKLWKL